MCEKISSSEQVSDVTSQLTALGLGRAIRLASAIYHDTSPIGLSQRQALRQAGEIAIGVVQNQRLIEPEPDADTVDDFKQSVDPEDVRLAALV